MIEIFNPHVVFTSKTKESHTLTKYQAEPERQALLKSTKHLLLLGLESELKYPIKWHQFATKCYRFDLAVIFEELVEHANAANGDELIIVNNPLLSTHII